MAQTNAAGKALIVWSGSHQLMTNVNQNEVPVPTHSGRLSCSLWTNVQSNGLTQQLF